MKKPIFKTLCIILLVMMFFTSCSQSGSNMKDGYYTAQMSDYDDHGWKEFVIICVQDGKISTVEYNAENNSGFIKSWDMSYMRTMNSIAGTYPNLYTRTYAANLLRDQSAEDIDAVSGATHSYHTFKQLAKAVIDKAKAGDKTVAIVTGED